MAIISNKFPLIIPFETCKNTSQSRLLHFISRKNLRVWLRSSSVRLSLVNNLLHTEVVFSLLLLLQVEMLYQRYFLKMNQSNMTNLITLLLLLCIGFLFLAAADFVIGKQPDTDQNPAYRLDKLLVLMCTSGCCIAIYGGKLKFIA